MEHAIHLGARHFISHVAPTAYSTTIKKVQAVLKKARIDDEYHSPDLDELNVEIAAMLDDGDNNDNHDLNDDGFDIADTIGKALALIKQVCHLQYFKQHPNMYLRSASLPKPVHSSNNAAERYRPQISSSFSGYEHAGH